MNADNNKELLKQAVELAELSPEPIGCATIIVLNGKILAKEFNSQSHDEIAINHAEIKAVLVANKLAGARKIPNATAYCSCEPCAMCLVALSYAKIGQIIYNKSMKDLFPSDPQSNFNSKEFVKSLNFQPRLEQVDL